MSTSDISKELVYDSRINQLPPRYAVNQGALSVTSAPFRAVSESTSNHQYNINAPSLQVFVDRALKWTSTFRVQFQVSCTPAGAGEVIFALGRDGAVTAFPLNSLVGTMTGNINDASVTFQSDQVLKEVLRLANAKKDRLQRACPTMLDKYASYNSQPLAVNNPIKGYADATDYDNVPNGAFWNVRYVYPDNATNAGTGAALLAGSPVTVNYRISGAGPTHNTGVGAGDAPLTAAGGAQVFTIALEVTSTEKLVLSPFVFADACEYSEIGLTGINNIQLSMAMSGAAVQRVIRNCSSTAFARAIVPGSMRYIQTQDAFLNSRIDVVFLTPNLGLDMPSKSVVPYSTFDRYVTPFPGTIAAGASEVISSQTVTLPGLPDKMLIYCKPRNYLATQGDYYLPIRSITMNLNNFSGLLSSFRAPDLYALSVKNGLEMDWNAWNGLGRDATTGNNIPLVGGFLVLALGEDLALQAGEAPGLQGQVTVQFNVEVTNQTAAAVTQYDLYMIPVFSGFFQTVAGSSRIVKNVLSPDDIFNAPIAPEGSIQGLQRITGGGFFDTLGSALQKGMQLYSKTKPLVSAVKGLLPEEGIAGKVKSGLSAVGYGQSGAGGAGAGRAGAGLSKRLM